MRENRGGFWLRFAAGLVDGLFLSLITYVLTSGLSLGAARATEFSIQLLYAVFVPLLWAGYTIGKRLFAIRIVRIDYMPLNLVTLLLREVVGKAILGIATFGLTIIISAFMIGLREDKRGIHDLVAGTYVKRNA